MICRNTERPWFDRLAAYLMRAEPDRERVQWAGTRNLPTEEPELAAVFMQATASRNVRVQKPAYQMVVSFAPDDAVDRVVMERVADGLLDGLALGEHQALLVAHQGEPRPHLHMVVNRVHPGTGRAWSTWHAWSRTREVLCDLEQALGLRALSAPLQTVHAVAQDVRLYERVLNLGSERHEAELNASAAQARWTRFEL
ncbi:MAG TPA: relaxase/mobilization nuclease domain-containing protein, partial [Gemmatimonadales bacterium]|nr:relaxase/mobilization nuclease domain-containing protein [Gemmatimonadales bacterium]